MTQCAAGVTLAIIKNTLRDLHIFCYMLCLCVLISDFPVHETSDCMYSSHTVGLH